MGCCAELVPGIKLADASCRCLWASSHGWNWRPFFPGAFLHLQASFTIYLWFETRWPFFLELLPSSSLLHSPSLIWNLMARRFLHLLLFLLLHKFILWEPLKPCVDLVQEPQKLLQRWFRDILLLLPSSSQSISDLKLDGLELASCISFFSLTNPVVVRTLET